MFSKFQIFPILGFFQISDFSSEVRFVNFQFLTQIFEEKHDHEFLESVVSELNQLKDLNEDLQTRLRTTLQSSEILTEQVTNLRHQHKASIQKLENDLNQKHGKKNGELQKSIKSMKNEINQKSTKIGNLTNTSTKQKGDLAAAEKELKLLDDDIRFLLQVNITSKWPTVF